MTTTTNNNNNNDRRRVRRRRLVDNKENNNNNHNNNSRQAVYCPNCGYVSFLLYLSKRQCIRCHKEQLQPKKVRVDQINPRYISRIDNTVEEYNEITDEIYNILGE